MPRPESTTLPIHAVLGLSTEELDEALVWARGRALQLLESLDDPELRALLGRETSPSPPRSTRPTPATRPSEPLASMRAAAPWDLPPVPRIPSRFVETIPSKSASPADPPASVQGSETASQRTASQRTASTSTPRPSPHDPPTARPSASPRLAPATPSMPPRASPTPAVPQREADAPAVRTDHTRRRAQRYSLSTPVVLRIDRMPGLLELNTRDISRHGIFIESTSPPQCHDRISVELPFPDGSGVVHLVGEVVRVVTTRQAAASGSAPGFGVTFAPVSGESRRELERLLEHARAGAAADVPRPRGATVTQAKTVVHVGFPGDKGSKGPKG
jgi:hypothetical protein